MQKLYAGHPSPLGRPAFAFGVKDLYFKGMKKLQFIVFALVVLSANANAQEGENIARVGSSGITGTYYDVKVLNDEIAYCSNYYGLVVMDISNPARPTPINILPTPGVALGLALRDSVLFLVDGYAGLIVYDLADDPRDPKLIANVELHDGSGDIVLHNDLAFIYPSKVPGSFVYVYNVSNPNQPEFVDRFETGLCECFAIYNDTLALEMNVDSRMFIWNIADIHDCHLIVSYDNPNPLLGQFAAKSEDDVIIIGDGAYDFSDYAEPRLLGTFEEGSLNLGSSFLIKDDLFYKSHSRRFIVYDISDVTSPRQILNFSKPRHDEHNNLSYGKYFDVTESKAFIAEQTYGLSILDISDLQNVRMTGFYDPRGRFAECTATDGFLYVVDWLPWNGSFGSSYRLRVYSLDNPTAPHLVNTLEFEDGIFFRRPFGRLKVFGDRLYTSCDGTVSAFSIEDPENPVPLFRHHFNDGFGNADDYEIDGDIVFGVARCIRIYSITDIENPEMIDVVVHQEDRTNGGIALDEHHAYVCDIQDGLEIYNRDDPRNLQILGVLPFDQGVLADEVVIYGDIAYVVTNIPGVGRVRICDVSDRSNPRFLSTLNAPYGVKAIEIADDNLYLSCGYRGIYAYSIEDPTRPALIGTIDTPGNTQMVEAKDGYLYAADMDEIGVYDVGAISGWWNVTASEESHDFGEVTTDSIVTWELVLSNQADKIVVIDSLSFTGSGFWCDLGEALEIGAGNSAALYVTFRPDTSREYASDLIVHCGQRNVSVSLTGRGVPNGVKDDEEVGQAGTPVLLSVSPNPFNSSTTITFTLTPGFGEAGLRIYNLSGRVVVDLMDGYGYSKRGKITPPTPPAIAGGDRRTVVWDASDCPAGVYLVRLESESKVAVRKLVLMK